MLPTDMLTNFAPASVATACASIILLVRGGGAVRIPFQGCQKSNSKHDQLSTTDKQAIKLRHALQLQS